MSTPAGGGLAGTVTLMRHLLRRDRIRLPIWVVVPVLLVTSTYSAYEGLYPTAASRAELTATMGTAPSLTLLYGRAYDLTSAGGFTVWRVGGFVAVLLAIFAVLTVVRHTRAEEDAGRAEMLASGVVGRYALLAAAVATTVLASAAAGLLVALGLLGLGAATAGAFAFGGAVALTGAVFAGVGAVAAQLGSYSRTASGMGLGVLGVAFLVRGWGDSSGRSWLSWWSPLGWASQVRAYAEDRWPVLALPALAAVVLIGVAAVLVRRRDVGLGLIAPREGRAHAPATLGGPLGLAWRLQRGTLIGWLIGFLVFGLVMGSLAGSIGDLLGDNPQAIEMFERMGGVGQLSVLFVAAILPILGVFTVLYGVLAVLRARTEETEDRVEPLLATPVSRVGWLASHLGVALGGVAALMGVGGAAVTIGAVASTPAGTLDVGEALVGALIQIPAAWSIVGLAAALVGLVPRFASLAWVAAGLALAITWLGPALGLSDALLKVSPFEHLPHVPGGPVTAGPLLVLGAIAAGLLAAAAAGMRRRDIG